MNKPVFKVLDDKGRLAIPKAVRDNTGIAKGDVVAITSDRGRVIVKKAIVLEDGKMPLPAKEAYAEAILRELDSGSLSRLMELAAKQLSVLNNDR